MKKLEKITLVSTSFFESKIAQLFERGWQFETGKVSFIAFLSSNPNSATDCIIQYRTNGTTIYNVTCHVHVSSLWYQTLDNVAVMAQRGGGNNAKGRWPYIFIWTTHYPLHMNGYQKDST